MKLAVGVRDIEDCAPAAERPGPTRRYATASHGPQAAGGGAGRCSIYWVINGSMLVRQRILDIIDDTRDNGEVYRTGAGSRAG
ncbi:MAG: DUF1489 family protein [Acetobacteraceae bacterium]